MTDQPSTPKRFFWRWSDGEYVYTGLYLWRGYFGGVVRLAGRTGRQILASLGGTTEDREP